MTKEDQIVLGQNQEHVAPFEGSSMRVHRAMIPELTRMKNDAKKLGFDLQVVSAFRDFQSQLGIWNAKATGKKPLLDSNAKPLDFSKLSKKEIVYSILRWSALPGASRHHWGTDLDVIDGSKIPAGYQVQLIPDEFKSGGMFSGLHEWLDRNMEKYDFFRPYEDDLGGESERWHISFDPISEKYLQKLSLPLLETAIRTSPIELKEVVLEELPEIYERFITNVSF